MNCCWGMIDMFGLKLAENAHEYHSLAYFSSSFKCVSTRSAKIWQHSPSSPLTIYYVTKWGHFPYTRQTVQKPKIIITVLLNWP